MQLSVEQFLRRIDESALQSSYFLYGDEPLQLAECGDALRRRAVAEGIVERLVFDVESASDWQAIHAESNAMSLFAERRLIELRLGSRKPDKSASATLEDIITRNSADDIFFISAAKLDANARKTSWFKSLEKHSVCVATQNLKAQQLPAWLNRRAARFNKRLSVDAAMLISERVEGNLLAAAQEVEKLCLLVESDDIDERDVMSAVSDSARFDVYQFVDGLLACDLNRAVRVLRGLREEGTEPVLVVWALGRELRQLAAMAAALARGQSSDVVMENFRVWSARKPLIRSALSRHSERDYAKFLCYSNYIDTVIKGGRSGAPWDDIEILVLRFCGNRAAERMTPAH